MLKVPTLLALILAVSYKLLNARIVQRASIPLASSRSRPRLVAEFDPKRAAVLAGDWGSKDGGGAAVEGSYSARRALVRFKVHPTKRRGSTREFVGTHIDVSHRSVLAHHGFDLSLEIRQT